MTVAYRPRMPATYRPRMPAATILDEIDCDDIDRRWNACVAVCATVWGAGLNSCASIAERHSWQHRYAEHVAQLARVHARNDPLAARGLAARGS